MEPDAVVLLYQCLVVTAVFARYDVHDASFISHNELSESDGGEAIFIRLQVYADMLQVCQRLQGIVPAFAFTNKAPPDAYYLFQVCDYFLFFHRWGTGLINL